MHNESGRRDGYSSGTSNRLWEYTERLTQRWKALAPQGFPKEWSFLGLVTIYIISPRVNVARTKTRKWRGRMAGEEACFGSSESLACMSGAEADTMLQISEEANSWAQLRKEAAAQPPIFTELFLSEVAKGKVL